MNERVLTPEGLEVGFATNVLGPYILTLGLIPVLQKTAGSRVITVTSAGMLTEGLNVNDVQSDQAKYDGTKSYSRQKRMQVELTHHWAATYNGIQFLSVHPGWADTPGVQSSLPSFYKSLKLRLRTPEQGADSILWCAAAKAAMNVSNGSFIEDRAVADEHVTWGGTASKPGDLENLVSLLNDQSSKY